MCNEKCGACSDGPIEHYHQISSSPQLYCTFKSVSVHCFDFLTCGSALINLILSLSRQLFSAIQLEKDHYFFLSKFLVLEVKYTQHFSAHLPHFRCLRFVLRKLLMPLLIAVLPTRKFLVAIDFHSLLYLQVAIGFHSLRYFIGIHSLLYIHPLLYIQVAIGFHSLLFFQVCCVLFLSCLAENSCLLHLESMLKRPERVNQNIKKVLCQDNELKDAELL